MKKKAFTLAELIITLTLIGVVGVLTIPAFLQNLDNFYNHRALLEANSILSAATERIKQDYGGDLTGVFYGPLSPNSSTKAMRIYSNYISFSNMCDHGDWSCNGKDWHNNYYTIQKSPITWGVTATASATASNGMLFLISFPDSATQNCNFSDQDTTLGDNLDGKACGIFQVDVNGFRPPNTLGRDIFSFGVTKEGAVIAVGSGYVGYVGNYGYSFFCPSNISTIIPGPDGRYTGNYCTARNLLNKDY